MLRRSFLGYGLASACGALAPRIAQGEDSRSISIGTTPVFLDDDVAFLRDWQTYLQRQEVLTEIATNVGQTFLGMTINCARCHNHKFDPVPQEDYYRLMALLTPAYNPQNWKIVLPYDKKLEDRFLPDVSPAETADAL